MPIADSHELSEIEGALTVDSASAAHQLQHALNHLADRERTDYPNSIKESISVIATSGVATDLFEFRRNGNVFTPLRNGVSFLTWTDTGNLVSTSSTNRRWGFLAEGNYPIFNAEFRSPAVNSIEAFDL